MGRTTGKWSQMAVIAHLMAPQLRLITEKIDFSGDFAICNRSNAYVRLENEYQGHSTIRVKMIENCNDVFTLKDGGIFDVVPFSCVGVPISCYSEIHGESNIRIRDPWQSEDIRIPLHV
jgi:hypothetical protein